ncbi:GtrA family protein [Sphingobium sp.]|uniref:GtrA family protein n=1 Tax=Sphingobium sp. TaxID=1912891 RepID=UPI003BB6E36F
MMAHLLDRRLITFLIAGGINTLFGYGVYAALVLIGMVPHIALIVGGVIGILFNFLTSSAVFRSFDLHRLPRFLAVYTVMTALNILLLEAAMRLGIGPLLAQAIILPFCTLTFFAMRRFVFAARSEQPS